MDDSKLEQAKLLIKSISLSLTTNEQAYELSSQELDAFIKDWCESESPPSKAELTTIQSHLKRIIDEVTDKKSVTLQDIVKQKKADKAISIYKQGR